MNAQPLTVKSVHPHPMTPQYYLSEIAKPADIEVLVSQDDFELALKELNPSVSEAEMDAYRRVQQQFQQGPPPPPQHDSAEPPWPQPNGSLKTAEEKPRSKGKGKGKGRA